MLTENLAEQKKWTDYVRPTNWINEVDSDLNCDKKFLIKGNVQQLLSDQSYLISIKLWGGGSQFGKAPKLNHNGCLQAVKGEWID